MLRIERASFDRQNDMEGYESIHATARISDGRKRHDIGVVLLLPRAFSCVASVAVIQGSLVSSRSSTRAYGPASLGHSASLQDRHHSGKRPRTMFTHAALISTVAAVLLAGCRGGGAGADANANANPHAEPKA